MRLSTRLLLAATAVATISTATLSADRVRLRSGQVVEGNFMSADVKRVRMLLADGSISEYPVADIVAVEFSERKAQPAPAPPPDPAREPAPITVPMAAPHAA